jgi:hypothetical protein
MLTWFDARASVLLSIRRHSGKTLRGKLEPVTLL